MSCYQHFTIEERERLAQLLAKGMGIREIARALERNQSSVTRELKRNGQEKNYSPSKAQKRYEHNREHSKRRALLSDEAVHAQVSKGLLRYWSPEQISHRLEREGNHIRISTSTIYRGFEKGWLDESLRQKLRIKGRRYYGKRNTRCGHLDIEYSIHERPASVKEREELGHWESDTVRGAYHSGCVATHVERKSRYCLFLKLENRSRDAYTRATIEGFRRLPGEKLLSLTVDHGKEFSGHRELMAALQCKVYFADPNCPNQRGTNENTNGLLRQYLPKRTRFDHLTQERVDEISDLINNRPRKCLGWKTPYEVFFDQLLHLT